MILDFTQSKDIGEFSWRFKGTTHSQKIDNAKIVKNYEFLEKIFVIAAEDNTSVLYVIDAEGGIFDRVVSTQEFFIKGIRGGILQPEFLITSKDHEPTIYTYNVKTKGFVDTGEIVN